MPRVTTEKAAHSPAALARVELLLRTWLRADEAQERAWYEACRAQHEAIDALRAIGGEYAMDGFTYSAGPSRQSLERQPCRTGKWKRGVPGSPVAPP
jgi:hypothetical protein